LANRQTLKGKFAMRKLVVLASLYLILGCVAGCSSDSQSITSSKVQEFCAKHGGIKEDATDEGEEMANHFTVECQDGSDVTGKNADPDSLIYNDSRGDLIDP
jgi:hypothetical protein